MTRHGVRGGGQDDREGGDPGSSRAQMGCRRPSRAAPGERQGSVRGSWHSSHLQLEGPGAVEFSLASVALLTVPPPHCPRDFRREDSKCLLHC